MFPQLLSQQLGAPSGPRRCRAAMCSSSVPWVQRLQPAGRLAGHSGCVNAVAFDTEGGETLISGSDDTRIILWDWQRGKQRLRFDSGHTNNVFQARMLPHGGGSKVVTCGADGQVRLCELPQGGARVPAAAAATSLLGVHAGRAHKLALDPLSPAACFYSCGEDGLVLHYDLRAGRSSGAVRQLLRCQRHCAVTGPTGRRLGLNAIHTNPTSPWQFALGGADIWTRVYDVRRTQQRPQQQQQQQPAGAGPASSSSSSAAAAAAGAAGRRRVMQGFGSSSGSGGACPAASDLRDEPVARLAPHALVAEAQAAHYQLVSGPHVTCVSFSRQGELLASYNDDDVYLFSAEAACGAPLQQAAGRDGLCGSHSGSGNEQARRDRSRGDAPAPAAAAPPTPSPVLPPAPAHGSTAAAASQQQQQQQGVAGMDRSPGAAQPPGAFLSPSALVTAAGAAARVLDSDDPEQGLRQQQWQQEQLQHRRQQSPAHLQPWQQQRVSDADDDEEELQPRTRQRREEHCVGGASAALAAALLAAAQRNPHLVQDAAPLTPNAAAGAAAAAAAAAGDPRVGAAGPDDDDDAYGGGDDVCGGDYGGPRLPNDLAGYEPVWGGRFYDPEAVGRDGVVASYYGHRNAATVKGVTFFGEYDEYVMSGSDCGFVYAWAKDTGEIVWWQEADDEVVNCLEPHPLQPLVLATSGIDHDVKLFAPTAAAPQPPPAAALRRVMAINQEAKASAADSLAGFVSPAAWLSRMLTAQHSEVRRTARGLPPEPPPQTTGGLWLFDEVEEEDEQDEEADLR